LFNQIPSTLREILSRLAGVRPSLLACGGFAVNPYLNKMIVTAYKASEDIQLTLSYTDAAGKTFSMQGGQPTEGFTLAPENGYYKFGTNETYTILNPYPGIWNLSTSNCDGIDVYFEAINADLQQSLPFSQRPQYDRTPFYDAAHPFYLEYTLRDNANNGAIVSQSDKAIFAVDMQAKVTTPDGTETPYQLKWDAEDQIFRSDQPLQVPLAGPYKLSIEGTSRRHQGEPVVDVADEAQVFNQSYTLFKTDGEFTGLNVTPFEMAPVTPETGQNAGSVHGTILDGWPLPVKTLPVRVRIVDEQGKTFTDPDAVLVDPAKSLNAQLTYIPASEDEDDDDESSGPISSPTITLHPDPAAPGEFVGEFPNFEHEGQQVLKVTVDPANVEQGYWPYSQEAEVNFNRTDCLFCRAGTYYSLLALIIVMILVMIIYNIAIRTNKISGSLIFVDGSSTIETFGLHSGKNFRKFTKKELHKHPELFLKRMVARNVGKRRRASVQEDAGLFTEGQDRIRIEGVSSTGRKFSVDLYPKTPTIYSGEETMAQMIYEPAE
jgi:hypothetical protein